MLAEACPRNGAARLRNSTTSARSSSAWPSASLLRRVSVRTIDRGNSGNLKRERARQRHLSNPPRQPLTVASTVKLLSPPLTKPVLMRTSRTTTIATRARFRLRRQTQAAQRKECALKHRKECEQRQGELKASITACRGCPLRVQCVCHPDRIPQRTLTVIKQSEGAPSKPKARKNAPIERVRTKFDSPKGRVIYRAHGHCRTRVLATCRTGEWAALPCGAEARSTRSGSSSLS